MSTDKHELIRRRAHEIWENEGRPEGAELRHWQQASDELDRQQNHDPPVNHAQQDDRDDAALLQGAGESGELDPPSQKMRNAKEQSSPSQAAPSNANVEITTGEKPARRKVKKTEAP